MLSSPLASTFRRRWLVGAALVVVGCESDIVPAGLSSYGVPPVTAPAPFVVSNPVHGGSSVLAADVSAPIADPVYISLPPGAIPYGTLATISVLRTQNLVFVSLFDGGFDPVPISAVVGDTIAVFVQMLGDQAPVSIRFTVPPTTPPIIVRTDPPPHKRDVPLNTSIIIVFSEPISASVLGGNAVQVKRGDTPVDGQFAFTDSSHTILRFAPASLLDAGTVYTVTVTQGVHDVNGMILQAPTTLDFTTAVIVPPPPGAPGVASIVLSPGTTSVPIYSTTQLTAVVRDAQGNELTDRHIVWTSSNNSMAGVSVVGLIAGIAPGSVTITATCEGIAATVRITVTPSPVVKVEITPAVATISGVPGATNPRFTATAWDAQGNVVTGRFVLWGSSDYAVAQPYGSTGNVLGVSPGTATITATISGVVGTAMVTVIGPPVASLTLVPNSATIYAPDVRQLNFTAKSSTGTVLNNRHPAWTSGNPGVASVDATGLVHGISTGTAVITAAIDGVSATALITVAAVTSVVVSPATANVSVGNVAQLTSVARTAQGITIFGHPVTWASSAPAVATVSTSGVVTGVSAGTATITASTGGVVGSATVTVTSNVVATVSVSPPSIAIGIGSTAQLSVTEKNAQGALLAGHTAVWASNNTQVVTVTSAGIITGVTGGTTTVTATVDGVVGSADVTVIFPIALSSITAGGTHTCGLTSRGFAYCWGGNDSGELGDGTTTQRFAPVAVAGGPFTSLVAGWQHTCGLTADGAAYCWGSNSFFQLGDRTATDRASPTPVAGGLTFTSLAAGDYHTCGVTSAGTAYCWGYNTDGQLGEGSFVSRYDPTAVSATVSFTRLVGGFAHTCGLTSDGTAYCWGANYSGQTGTAAGAPVTSPVAVAGGLNFASFTAGGDHTCGVTLGGAAFCWGYNDSGELGINTGVGFMQTPTAVVGGLTFARLGAGYGTTCGQTLSGGVYCWGENDYGQAGNGTNNWPSTPTAVSGGFTFTSLSVGSLHACGFIGSGALYCWGDNEFGQLGDGSTTSRKVPTQMPSVFRGQ